MPRKGASSGGFDISLLFSNIVLLALLGLAGIAWIIAFVGQIAAEADGSRQGVLWFNIFLQLFLILGIAATTATDSVALARLQISAYLAVALVFAVHGIDQGIYSNSSSLNAVTAGWFILTIVDVIWLLFFTSDEDSAVYGLLSGFGNGRLGGPGGRGTRSTGPISRANNSSAAGGFGSGGGSYSSAMQGVGNGGYQPAFGQATSAADITQAGVGMPRSQVGGQGSIRSGHTGPNAAGPGSQVGAKSDASHGAPDGLAAAGGMSSVSHSAPHDDAQPLPGYGYRARALYAYTANADDPTEISFSKGEILDIVDNSGKWWQARNGRGDSGIVPSNYMQIL